MTDELRKRNQFYLDGEPVETRDDAIKFAAEAWSPMDKKSKPEFIAHIVNGEDTEILKRAKELGVLQNVCSECGKSLRNSQGVKVHRAKKHGQKEDETPRDGKNRNRN